MTSAMLARGSGGYRCEEMAMFRCEAVGLEFLDSACVRGTRLVVQSLCGLGLVGRGPL